MAATHADGVGTLVYSLDANGASNFDVDSSTGQLKTKTVFDYEIDGTSYTLTVSASDGMDSYSNADTAVDSSITVTITVTDINEKPQFSDDAADTQTVAEDVAVGDPVGSPYTATDPENDVLTYSLGGADASLFQVGTDGQLEVADTLDFEDKSRLVVIIQVTDSEDIAGIAETPRSPSTIRTKSPSPSPTYSRPPGSPTRFPKTNQASPALSPKTPRRTSP